MKEKSHTDWTSQGKKSKETFMMNLYVEMLLSETLLKAERERLIKQIDHSLDTHNRHEFFKLSNEYRKLAKRFGT